MGALAAKRGGISISRLLPPFYPRNVRMLWPAVFLSGLLALVSFMLFVLPEPTITPETVGWILFGGMVVLILRGVGTVHDYVYQEGYRNHSARTVLLEPFQQLVAIGGLVLAVIVGAALFGVGESPFISGTVLVSIIFLGKYAADVRAWQLRHDPEQTGWFARIYGSKETEIEPEPVSVPSGEPAMVVRPSQTGVCFGAIVKGLRYLVSPWALIPSFLVLIGLFGSLLLVTIGMIGLVALIALRASVYYLQFGTVEYRWYDDVVIVFDRLLDEPQARLEAWAVTDVKTTQGLLGRLLGTTTIFFETNWESQSPPMSALPEPEDYPTIDPDANRPLTVAHIRDSEQLFDVFDVT